MAVRTGLGASSARERAVSYRPLTGNPFFLYTA
jgi:hypothetical protein